MFLLAINCKSFFMENQLISDSIMAVDENVDENVISIMSDDVENITKEIKRIETEIKNDMVNLIAKENEMKILADINQQYEDGEAKLMNDLKVKNEEIADAKLLEKQLAEELEVLTEMKTVRKKFLVEEEEHLQNAAKKLDNDLVNLLKALDIKFTLKQGNILNEMCVLYELTLEGVSVVLGENLIFPNVYNLINITPKPKEFDKIKELFDTTGDVAGLLTTVRKWGKKQQPQINPNT